MNKRFFLKLVGMVFLVFSLSAQALVVTHKPGVSLNVISEQLTLDKSAIASVKIIKPVSVLDHRYGILLSLTKDASAKFKAMTANNLNKQLVIIDNDVVISASHIMSPVGGNFQITGLSKGEADKLVAAL